MLAAIGSIVFDIVAPNIHEVGHDTGADYAEKQVMGRRPTLEFMGEKAEVWSLSGKLFPAKFGGMHDMDDLHTARMSGKAFPFMRGDGVPLGWVVIESVREKSSHLDPSGVGQVIEFEISVKRADPPSKGQVSQSVEGVSEPRATSRRRTGSSGGSGTLPLPPVPPDYGVGEAP